MIYVEQNGRKPPKLILVPNLFPASNRNTVNGNDIIRNSVKGQRKLIHRYLICRLLGFLPLLDVCVLGQTDCGLALIIIYTPPP